MRTIGWIGTGVLGSAIVNKFLEAGNRVVIFNRTIIKTIPLEKKGAIVVSSPRKVAEICDLVFLCLTGKEATNEVIFNPKEGIVAASRQGICIIDSSTIGPKFALEIQDRLRNTNISYIDCPVSGGPEGALNGTLTAVMSGDAELIEKYRDIVSEFASSIYYVGEVGKAQLLKVINNLVESINLWGAAEAIVLGLKAGITIETMRPVLLNMRGYSTYMDLLIKHLCMEEKKTSASLEVRLKDLNIAREVAAFYNVDTPVLNLTEQLFVLAVEKQGRFADQTECIKVLMKDDEQK